MVTESAGNSRQRSGTLERPPPTSGYFSAAAPAVAKTYEAASGDAAAYGYPAASGAEVNNAGGAHAGSHYAEPYSEPYSESYGGSHGYVASAAPSQGAQYSSYPMAPGYGYAPVSGQLQQMGGGYPGAHPGYAMPAGQPFMDPAILYSSVQSHGKFPCLQTKHKSKVWGCGQTLPNSA